MKIIFAENKQENYFVVSLLIAVFYGKNF